MLGLKFSHVSKCGYRYIAVIQMIDVPLQILAFRHSSVYDISIWLVLHLQDDFGHPSKATFITIRSWKKSRSWIPIWPGKCTAGMNQYTTWPVEPKLGWKTYYIPGGNLIRFSENTAFIEFIFNGMIPVLVVHLFWFWIVLMHILHSPIFFRVPHCY